MLYENPIGSEGLGLPFIRISVNGAKDSLVRQHFCGSKDNSCPGTVTKKEEKRFVGILCGVIKKWGNKAIADKRA